MIPLGKQICISFSGTWLNLEVSPQWRGWAHDQSSQTSRQPRSSTFSMLGIKICLFQKFRTSHLEVQQLWGHYLISNTLATLKTGFMITNEPLISNFVFEFQFASAFFFFFLKYGEAGTPPSSSPLHPAPAFTCFHQNFVLMWFSDLLRATVGGISTEQTMPRLWAQAGGHLPLCWLSSGLPAGARERSWGKLSPS